MRSSLHLSAVLGLFALSACAPKDVIPTTPQHPANPDVSMGASPAPAQDAAVDPPSQAHEGHTEAPGQAHEGHAEAAPVVDEKVATAEADKAAFEKARPVFTRYCGKCHSSSGAKKSKEKLAHFNIDAYPFGGHHAATAGKTVREVLGVEGGKATMPADKPGSVQGADLEALVEWSKAFDRAHEAGLHQHGEGGHDHGKPAQPGKPAEPRKPAPDHSGHGGH